MIAFAASNTTIAFQFSWFWIDSITAITIVTWATKELSYICYIFYSLACVIWKFSAKLIGKETLEMIKFVAFSWSRATVNVSLVSLFWLLFSLFASSPSTITLVLNINSYFKTHRTLEFILLIFTIMTFRLINTFLFPLL